MPKEMLINVSEGEECRIALLEDGRLEELYMERTSSTSHVGNIYKGRVTNVEASIQAAFVDFGLGRNGFLHISDLMPTYFGRKGEDIVETVGKKMARRDRPPIQRCLRRGDDIVVQIIKEGIGTKGPTLSSYLSIPGRYLVMMPGVGKMGVSQKIEDDAERRRLRQILDGLKPPKDVGFIIRTAGVGKSKAEIERDLKYLARLWETLKKKRDMAGLSEQPLIFGLRDPIGVAGQVFEPGAIPDNDHAPLGLDHARPFQDMDRGGDAGAARAQHHRHEFMGEGKLIPFRSVIGGQDPSGEPRLDIEAGIGIGGLADLDREIMKVTPEHRRKGRALPHKLLQRPDIEAQDLGFSLAQDHMGCVDCPEAGPGADDAFGPDHAHLDPFVCPLRQKREDALVDEIGMFERRVRCCHNGPKLEPHRFKEG